MPNAQELARLNVLPDEEVVSRVVEGETELFEILMRRHNERIYRAARAITRDADEAEDVVQHTHVKAFTHLRQFTGRAQFATWLTTIAVHEAIARVRRRGKYEPFDDEVPVVEPFPLLGDPERQTSTGELHALLEWAIDQLPDGAREIFVLREVEGLSTTEAAECLGVSTDVVKARLSRARAALRRALTERTGAAARDVFRFYRPRCDRVVTFVMSAVR